MPIFKLRQLLEEKKLSAKRFSEMVGVFSPALYKQLDGSVQVRTAIKYAKALNVPIWRLFYTPEEVMETLNIKSNTFTCPRCGTRFTVSK